MHFDVIGLLGGTGFLGQNLVTALARRGVRMRVLTRKRERHRDLLVFPTVELVETDVHDAAALERSFGGLQAVVNLCGILNPAGAEGFSRVHAELPAKVASACSRQGVRLLVHVSALGVSEEAPSEYLRSKWMGEQALRDPSRNGTPTSVFRPSVIFGPGDRFFTRFAELLQLLPGPFPLACPRAKLQPVYVGDVVQALCKTLEQRSLWNETFEVAGPHVYRLAELVEYTARVTGVRKRVIPLSPRLSRIEAQVLEHFPGKPLSLDTLRSLEVDNVTRDNALLALGIAPTGVEAVVPGYLGKARKTARLGVFRRLAHR